MSLLHEQWEADGMREQMYVHPYLTEQSIVWEIGAYKGLWTSEILRRYNPHMCVFEPIAEFFEICKNQFEQNPKIVLLEIGLGDCSRIENFSVQEDATGRYCLENGFQETVQIINILDFCNEKYVKAVDLIQINCEGAEYGLLDCLIDSGYIKKFKHLQIQFHNVEQDSRRKMENLRERLATTHNQKYCYDFIFEFWSIK